MSTSQLSKQDYLKKYLSDGDKKKKKKKSTQNPILKLKIIDDDIDLKNMRTVDSDELEIYDVAEEAPQIVGYVDERPQEVRLMSEFRLTKKWRIVTDEFGIDDVKVVPIDEVKQEVETEIKTEVKEEPLRSEPDGNDVPPVEIKVESSDSDASPPRPPKTDSNGGKRTRNQDLSPPRKSKRGKSESDSSPPRRSRRRKDSDVSPERIKTEKSDSDASPPRRSRKNKDFSPERRIKKEIKTEYDSDASPPRRSRKNKDFSPPRSIKKEIKKECDSDASPPRRRNESDSDSLPERSFTARVQSEKTSSGASRRRRLKSPDVESKSKGRKTEAKEKAETKLRNTLGGKKSGLQNAKELRKEIEELKEREKVESANAQGRNEEVVMRDRKTGKRIDPKEEARKRREREEKEAEKVAQYSVWGKGLKQVQDSQDKLKDDLYEMSKPLARYADDKDLDEMLKNKEWDGDPMLEYIKKKRKKKDPTNSKSQYEGSYMPNRYGIKPGHRWDGVDRSNGYEKKWFEEQNAKKAREEEAFKWSTADM